MVSRIFRLPRGTGFGDRGSGNTGTKLVWEHLSRGIKFFGTTCPRETKFVGDHLSRGIDFMRILCPGGQAEGIRKYGDQKSGDQMGSGPNASQP